MGFAKGRCMKTILHGISLALLIAVTSCAPAGGDKETAQAEKNLQEVKKSEAVKCDGTGSEFSGQYFLVAEEGKGKCSGHKEKIDVIDAQFKMACQQKNDSFECKQSQDGYKLSGCINKDGSFSISDKSDLGYFKKYTQTVGATDVEDLTWLEVDAEGNGSLKFSSIASNKKQKKTCNIEFAAVVTHGSEKN